MSASRGHVSGLRMSADARRIEAYALNASGAFQSLLYDGWLIGYRPGATKRLRCVNPFYPSTLPLAEKVAHCVAFHRAAGLPPLFRLLPFAEPPELDRHLERAGWTRFERTLVQCATFGAMRTPPVPDAPVDLIAVPEWVAASAPLLGLAGDDLARTVARERAYPLPQIGAVIRRDREVVACGLVKLEADAAGLFAVHTARAHAAQGLGRAIVAALIAEARRRGAGHAYLQVTADNAAATALYRHFGFATAYDYWYRRIDP